MVYANHSVWFNYTRAVGYSSWTNYIFIDQKPYRDLYQWLIWALNGRFVVAWSRVNWFDVSHSRNGYHTIYQFTYLDFNYRLDNWRVIKAHLTVTAIQSRNVILRGDLYCRGLYSSSLSCWVFAVRAVLAPVLSQELNSSPRDPLYPPLDHFLALAGVKLRLNLFLPSSLPIECVQLRWISNAS